MKIILASQSPYRKKQLEDLGLKFKAVRPLFDEDTLKNTGLSPRVLAKKLAIAKARSLSQLYPNDVIIGADQLVAFKNKILGKPGSFKKAFAQLKSMSGQKHELVTAVAVHYNGRTVTKLVTAKIEMRRLSDNEIRSYLMIDRPYDCAGSYKFEKAGLSLVKRLHVTDPSSLIGLPLISLTEILRSIK